MPSNVPYDEQVSHIEQFLEGYRNFTFIFNNKVQPLDNGPDSDSNGYPRPILVLLEYLQCMNDKDIIVENGSINKSFLTRKNLSNTLDIQQGNLNCHAKEVEANCKKALAL